MHRPDSKGILGQCVAGSTRVGLKRLIELVRDSAGMPSAVLAGHPKLKSPRLKR